jgi:hypothetical protein
MADLQSLLAFLLGGRPAGNTRRARLRRGPSETLLVLDGEPPSSCPHCHHRIPSPRVRSLRVYDVRGANGQLLHREIE